MSWVSRVFRVERYNLGETLDCGQCFRWEWRAPWWWGVVGERWVRAREVLGGVEVGMWCRDSDAENWDWALRYFQFEEDYEGILASFPKDRFLAEAVRRCEGLRLLRQPWWECLASFILSSSKQIVQIRSMVGALSRNFGREVGVEGVEVFAFPSAARLSECSEAELRRLKLGFRAPYLLESARIVAGWGERWEELEGMGLERAREVLVGLPGVGPKIADCVLLFAGGYLQAFPVDVWVRRVLRECYFPSGATEREALEFSRSYFGEFGGYAQQFLFHGIRKMRER